MMISDRDILNGVVPADLDDKAEAAQLATRWGKRSVSIQAMLIASARRDYFGANLVEWVEWCAEYCGVTKGDRRSHLDAVGRMLLSLNTDKYRKYFNILFDMDSEKLIALQRLMVKDVSGEDNPGTLITFIESFKGELGSMSRDALRQRVKLFLSMDDTASEAVSVKAQSVQMVFPGFEKYLGQLSEYTLDTVPSLLKDSGTAMKAGYGGFILLGGLVNAIRDGKKLLTAEDLQGLKGQLLDLVDQIDDLTTGDYEPEDLPEEEPAEEPEEELPEEPEEEPAEESAEEENLRKPDFLCSDRDMAFFDTQHVENEDCDSRGLSHATITNQNDRCPGEGDTESPFTVTGSAENEGCDNPPLSHATINDRRKKSVSGGLPFDIGEALGADRRWGG